jgi:hypothetical protein
MGNQESFLFLNLFQHLLLGDIMKLISILIPCVLCFIWNLAWGDQTDVKDKGLQYQKIVTDMKDLTANLGNPLEIFYTNKAKKEMKFDAASYFAVLKTSPYRKVKSWIMYML